MSANRDITVIFSTYGQFGGIWRPDSACMVRKVYIFINSNLLSYKHCKQNKNISNTALVLVLWVKVLFLSKMQNDVHISKIKNVLVLKAIFSEITYVCVPGYQISILWDRWGDEFNPNALSPPAPNCKNARLD